jgi:GNAT superfamily N-acetyltransferase
MVPGVNLRAATWQDIEAIASVVNAHSQAALDTQRALIDPKGALRFARYVPDNAERIVATTGTGHVVGFLALNNQSPHLVNEISGAVHPACRSSAVGIMLHDWAEQRARQLLPLSPPGARVVLQYNVFESDIPMRSLLAESGYRPVREWIHLRTELMEPPLPPAWPDGISVRLMDQQRDWPAVGAALEEAFVDHWGQTPLEQPVVESDLEESGVYADGAGSDDENEYEDDPYSNSRDFCFVVLCGSDIAGVCLGNARTVEWLDCGKVGSLSVRRPYRRRGIARALMLHALSEFYRHGIRRVVTDTDARSFTGANRLYEQLGMQVYRRELVYEKEDRMGRELRALSPHDLPR